MTTTTATETTWCVYLPEWVRVHVSTTYGPAGQEECGRAFTEHYLGKVRSDDWRICRQSRGDPSRYRLELRLPNLKGEYKDKDKADGDVSRLGSGAVVVEWGSPEEDRLLDYGRRRFRTAPVVA